MRRVALIFCAGLCVGAAGCGKSLVPGTAYDRSLLHFEGKVYPVGGLAHAVVPMVSLLWTDPYQKKQDLPMPANWLRSALVPAEDPTMPDTYDVDLFRPPPPEALVDVPVPSSDPSAAAEVARLAIAEIVLVEDLDPDLHPDGTFGVTGPRADIVGKDRFLGGSTVVVTYVERGPATPLTLATIGYQLVSYDCEGRLSKGTSAADPSGIDLIVQSSTSFPEVRNCRRTHSP